MHLVLFNFSVWPIVPLLFLFNANKYWSPIIDLQYTSSPANTKSSRPGAQQWAPYRPDGCTGRDRVSAGCRHITRTKRICCNTKQWAIRSQHATNEHRTVRASYEHRTGAFVVRCVARCIQYMSTILMRFCTGPKAYWQLSTPRRTYWLLLAIQL